MDGYYEWLPQSNGCKKERRPHYISAVDGQLLMAAALWQQQYDEQMQPIFNFTIITTQANDNINYIHERMPLILNKENSLKWLNLRSNHNDVLKLLGKRPAQMQAKEVNQFVNSVKNNSPQCLAPPEPPMQLELF